MWDPADPNTAVAALEGIQTLVYLVGVPYTDFRLHPILFEQVLTAATQAGVERCVLVGTVYPFGFARTPLVREDDCVDRIVLNAFFRMGHGPGGFRVLWRALSGSEETLAHTHLMRMAGRFSRRIHGYAKANGIPVVHCPAGERKHELAEEYLAKTNNTQGLFLILVGRAQAPVWDMSANHHFEPKKPMPYVNHYSFPLARSRVGPHHHQDQRASSVPRPGNPQWS